MSDEPRIKVRVTAIEGHCAVGHRVGDEFEVGLYTPAGICNTAYIILLPAIRVLQAGGRLPWQKEVDRIRVACSDPNARVVFEVFRACAADREEGPGRRAAGIG